QAAGRKKRGTDRGRLARNRQRRARPAGRLVLGLRRHPARLGRVEDAGERRQDFLILGTARPVSFLRRAPFLTASKLVLPLLDCSAPWPSPQRGLAPLALQPRAPGARGQ